MLVLAAAIVVRGPGASSVNKDSLAMGEAVATGQPRHYFQQVREDSTDGSTTMT